MTQEKYLQVNKMLKRLFKWMTGLIITAIILNLVINLVAYFVASSDDRYYSGQWNLYIDYIFDCMTTCLFTIGLVLVEIGVYYCLVKSIKEI